MNYGPEFVSSLVPELKTRCASPLQRVESGGDWCAFAFKSCAPLFFTWNPETFGICTISSDELRELRSGGVKTPFAMGLQRHLVGGSMVDVSCIAGDRVLKLRFQRYVGGGVSRETTLILELMGRMSNAIFTDESGIVLEAAKHVHPDVNRYRSVVPGSPYMPPPPVTGVFPNSQMSDDELAACLRTPRGLSRPVAHELLRLWECGCHDLVREALFGEVKIFQRLGNCLTSLGAPLPGAKIFDGTGLALCQKFIAGEIERRAMKNIAARAAKILDRQRGRRAKHAEGLRSQIQMAEDCDKFRIAGEAILQNLDKTTGRAASAIFNYWDAEGQKSVEVALDPSLDLQGNAKNYFKKYRKYRTDVAQVRERLEIILAELADIESLTSNLKRVKNAEKLTSLCGQIQEQYDPKKTKSSPKKAKKSLPPHLRFSFHGSPILVGMNERGNRYVTFSEASPDDLWFHVHEFPGSHVILKNPPADPQELDRAIRAASSLALCYSECTDDQSAVDFTEKKHVRHISGKGPANVTYKFPRTAVVGPNDWQEILRAKEPKNFS